MPDMQVPCRVCGEPERGRGRLYVEGLSTLAELLRAEVFEIQLEVFNSEP
jgi:hypothetical protein